MKRRKHGKRDIWDFDDFDVSIRRVHEELDGVFSRMFEGLRPMLGYGGKQLQKWSEFRMPVSNVYQTENSVIATFELPGVDKKDIDLNVTENSIEVSVKAKAEKEEKEKGFYAYQAKAQSFYRKVPLPAEAKADQADASYREGVLRVEIPKTKKEIKKGKKIEIK